MKTFKLLTLATIAFIFAACKASQPTGPPAGSGPSVGEVMSTLDTTESKCYALVQANPGSSPQQIIMLTAAWLQTQPNVQGVEVLDSLTIDIAMKSGLHSIFSIELTGSDGLALTRGGGPKIKPLRFGPSVPAGHTLANKNVLIYLPCENNDDGAMRSGVVTSIYQEGEIDSLINIFKKANQGFNVTVLYGDTLSEVSTFGNYGIFFIDTHGLPWGFLSGVVIPGFTYDTGTLNEATVKELLDGSLAGPGTYEGLQDGSLRVQLCNNWADILKVPCCSIRKNVLVTSKYISQLPPMPNTIIVGNFCYSGWTSVTSQTPKPYPVDPIATAFTNTQPLAYYSYGYPNGTSALLDNTFGKCMEDSLAQALVIYGDSTGEAYKMANGSQYTAQLLNVGHYSLDMLFNHFGADDYSYMPCIDSFTDVRDGQLYHTICIGNQIWMQENLNFNAPGSFYYKNSPGLDAIYGRIYPWTVAMSGVASSNAVPSGVKGVCPYGWHIPSTVEWQTLRTATYSANAIILNSTNPNIGGWIGDTSATNSSGFSALAGGYFNYGNRLTTIDSGFAGLGSSTLFHTSTIGPNGPVCIWVSSTWPIAKADVQPSSDPSDPNQPSSNAYCRCVKDP